MAVVVVVVVMVVLMEVTALVKVAVVTVVKAVVLLALTLVLVLEVVAVEVVVRWRAGGVIDTLAAVLAIDVLINVVNTVAIALGFAVPGPCSVDVMSDVAVDLLMDTLDGVLTVVLIVGLPGIGAGALVDVNVNVFTGLMSVKFALPALFICCSAFDCGPMPALDCPRVLQAWMPSYHVCSSLPLLARPQFPNQEPPRPQQLLFPDFLTVPHLGHTKPIAVVVAACVDMRHWSKHKSKNVKTINTW